MPTPEEIAEALRRISRLMELAGENRFRAAAFDRAARTVEAAGESLNRHIESRTLTELKGIGNSIADEVYRFDETGTMPLLDELLQRVPSVLLEWLEISGLGPKNIVRIHKELGISSTEELHRACSDGRVAGLPGLGEKSARKILRSIEWRESHGNRILLSEALSIADRFSAALAEHPGVQQLAVAGSLRRSRETIGDIDLLAAVEGDEAASVIESFASRDSVIEQIGRGETKCSVRTATGRQVDLRIVPSAQFGAALLYFTGSKEHNVELRRRAREHGFSLNEYGLFHLNEKGDADENRPVETGTEEEIYRVLGLEPIPPELREGRGEIERFENGKLPDLVRTQDIRGVIHAHSTWSDGRSSIEEMARAARALGYEYLGITDHSRSAAYAGGLEIDRVKRQWEEIDRLNEQFAGEEERFVIFKGIESDILADGSLDYPDEVLEGFDFVIASVHSGLEMPREKMTDRFRRAILHPAVRMVGHPTGRLLLRRKPSELDLEELIELAALHDTAIEINANPWRLDLDWRLGPAAAAAGLLTSINPDAHTVEGIDDIDLGVRIARKAWFEPGRVLNTYSAESFAGWASRRGGNEK